MFTPHPHVLDRKISPEITPIVNQFADLLDEAVNFGTNIFAADMRPKTDGEENIPPVMLFRHFLDLLDSISILNRSSTADPSKLLLRGAFEVLLNLEYLFEKDTFDRCISYVFCEVLHQIKQGQRIESHSRHGEALRSSYAAITKTKEITPDISRRIREKIKEKWSILEEPKYASAFEKYKSLKKQKIKRIPWYRFDSNISSIEELAKHLNRSPMYELYYRKWSGATHGTDLYAGKLKNNVEGGVGIVSLRSPKELQATAGIALTFSLIIFEIYIRNRVPSQMGNFKVWQSSVLYNLQFVSGPPLIVCIPK